MDARLYGSELEPLAGPRRAAPGTGRGRGRGTGRGHRGQRCGDGRGRCLPPGLVLLQRLAAAGVLVGYFLLPAIRADFLRRLRRNEEAASAYQEAAALAGPAPSAGS